jgi:hypothetical protein
MRSPHKRTAEGGIPGGSEDVSAAAVDTLSDIQSPPQEQERPLIDRYGNRHAESVLINWSPQILRILGGPPPRRERR